MWTLGDLRDEYPSARFYIFDANGKRLDRVPNMHLKVRDYEVRTYERHYFGRYEEDKVVYAYLARNAGRGGI